MADGGTLRQGASPQVVVVIPARYGSTRFPGKPLALVAGKPLIQQVYERVRHARGASRVIVATDDARIHASVTRFGGKAIETPAELRTGSDRVAFVARQVPADVYINLQGDEIPLSPAFLEDLIAPFLGSGADVGTLKRALADEQELQDPNVVKVVTSRDGDALYFSRSPIPYLRDRHPQESAWVAGLHWKHLGVYAYTAAALARFTALPTGSLEGSEQLEQLRLLESGMMIRVWETKHSSLRIDVPADVQRAEQILTHEDMHISRNIAHGSSAP